MSTLVKVFIKNEIEKRGKWLTPEVVLPIDRIFDTVTVLASSDPTMKVTFEDMRAALVENYLDYGTRERRHN